MLAASIDKKDGNGDAKKHAVVGSDPSAAAEKFNHPYTPYSVQMQFMKTAYDVLQQGNGQVGILESPTGTGKSLSLICAAMTWLRQFERGRFEASVESAREKFLDEPDWIVEQMLRQRRTELQRKWERREARLAAVRKREGEERQSRGAKRRRVGERTFGRAKEKAGGRDGEDDEEAEFLLTDHGPSDKGDSLSWLSKDIRAMIEPRTAPGKADLEDNDDDDDGQDNVKIFYTSRTHSQLTQFIAELRRPSFPSSLPQSCKTEHENTSLESEPVKHVPLSSRQRLCINPAVSRLGSVAAINDRCAELHKPKKSRDGSLESGGCPYVLKEENRPATRDFRDTALATLPDIEDLFQLGKTLKVCPYYASRAAVPGAEIVTLPYPLLLQKDAREALGINLKDSVVIIDEAHNIMDAVASVYAAAIKLTELRRARQLLEVYVRRFGKKLKGENRVMVGQLGRVIQGLSEWMDATLKTGNTQGIVDPSSLLKHKGADQINLFGLVKYIQESKLAFKVESYSSYIEDQENKDDDGRRGPVTAVLHTLVSFLQTLTNLSDEGRIFYEKQPPASAVPTPDMKLSYLLLSPTHAFSSIASSARAVILAGGTMSPFTDYLTHLFPTHPRGKISTLSCGHVIPASSLCVWTLAAMRAAKSSERSSAESSGVFEFSFQKRGNKAMVRDLGMALLNLCTVVPDGVVVFFPSYGYLDEVVQNWQTASPNTGVSIWDRLQTKKAVFYETKGASSDGVLEAYSEAILGDKTPSHRGQHGSAAGALLLSVVGGKMSEGINFADRLGRCVVIVGLPFPNIHSADWKARMEYIQNKVGGPAGKQAASEFYENACMRAVNQSIGRAIRHRNDYACIVLADRRFATDRIRSKLPAWIMGGLEKGSDDKGLSDMMSTMRTFFKSKAATS